MNGSMESMNKRRNILTGLYSDKDDASTIQIEQV